MSYNLAFWAGGDDLDADETYLALEENHIDGVRVIDAGEVLGALDALEGWSREPNFLYPPGSGPEGGPAFDFRIGTQLAEFIGYGIQDGDHFNAIIDALHPLGFRLYDPQVRERFL